jgi:hypothetical protein
MSAQSGIKVPDDLQTAFSSAVNDASNVRALVFTIQGGKHLACSILYTVLHIAPERAGTCYGIFS